jgi:predicted cation transporter
MKDTIGRILTIGGVLGVVYFGWQYYEDSESFEAFGADVAVSTGDYTPIIISAVVMLAGIVITRFNFK